MKKNNVVVFPQREELLSMKEAMELINPELLSDIRLAATDYLLNDADAIFTKKDYDEIEHLIILGVSVGMKFSIRTMEGVFDGEDKE